MNCENCAIPQGACGNVGNSIQIGAEKRYGDKRARKVTVWCCSESCAIQAAGISEYGGKTSAWPVTLSQYTTLFRRRHGDLHERIR